MPAYRLFLPSVPFLYILSFYFLEKVTIRKPFFILILLLTFFFLIYQNYVIHSQIRSYVNVFKTYKSLGKWYSHNLPLNSTLALCRIGNIGYYSNMRIIDLVGLTDKNIALNGLTVDYLKKENITYLQILSRTPLEEGIVPVDPQTKFLQEAHFFDDFKVIKQVIASDGGNIIIMKKYG